MNVPEMLGEAENMPYGEARTILLERAVAEAETHGDADLLFHARLALTSAYQHGGEPGKSFAVFSRNVSAYDAEPGRYQARHYATLLWHFKWIANDTRTFPEVPLDRTISVLDDMERRYREAGHGLHAVYSQRCYLAQHLGDKEAAAEWYHHWSTTPRDRLSDCIGCDPSGKVEYLTWMGRDEEAVRMAAPVLAGELSCVEQPQSILTHLLEPLVRTGRPDDAVAAHQRSYRIMQGAAQYLSEFGIHLEFLALTGNEARGLEILERELPLLDRPPSPAAALDFLTGAAMLLRRLDGLGQGELAVRGTPVARLRTELEARAAELAARFDARNGTAERTRLMREKLDAEPLAEHLPLTPHARRSVPPPPPAEPVSSPEATPEDLLDQAQRAWQDGALPVALAAWERYDELTSGHRPDPRRLDGRGLQAVLAGDREAAERFWREAVELHEDEALRQATIGRIGQVRGDVAQVEGTHRYLSEHGPEALRRSSTIRLAQAYAGAERFQDAIGLLEGSTDGTALALLGQLIGMDDPERALAVVAKARDALRGGPRVLELAEACLFHAQLMQNTGGIIDEALGAYDEALAAAPRTEPALRAAAHAMRGQLLVALGRAPDAAEDLIEAVATFTALGDAMRATYARVDLGAAYLATGRAVDALIVAEEALAMLDPEDTGNRLAVRWTRAQALRQDHPEDALAELLALAPDYDNPWQTANTMRCAGEVLDRLDRDAEAADAFAEAAAGFTEAEDLGAAGYATRRQALSLFWAGSPERSLEVSARAEAVLDGLAPDQSAFELAALRCDRARALYAVGRVEEALASCREGAGRLRDLGEEESAEAAERLLKELAQ